MKTKKTAHLCHAFGRAAKALFMGIALAAAIGLASSVSAATVNLSNVNNHTTLQNGDTVTGELTGQYKISIADGATVTLSNAVINGVNDSACPWAGLTCLGDAEIVLAPGSENFVKGFYEYYPGIHVPAGYTLTISGRGSLDASRGSLTVRGGGGNGGYAAGIGAGHSSDANRSCGDIVIQSGKVTAYGGQNSAGIGGAYGAACGRITIYGGDIDASSSNYGPGIGGGRNGSCGRIYIEGGTVVAKGGYGSAGICGPGATCPEVVINSGIDSVTAISGGGGRTPIETLGVDKISVDDSLLDTTSADGLTRTIVPAPVWDGNLATLTGDVTIESDMTLYGELAGQYKITVADGVTVTLDNAVVTNGLDNSSYPWAGLTCLGDAEIVLAPGSVNTVAAFNNYYPGIYVPAGSTLTITGTGTLNATGGIYAAAIGAGYESGRSCGAIVIEGGTITATGGYGSAGIGGGWHAKCDGITIAGGTVTATGGTIGAGIGGGRDADCGGITITGGTITATGSSNCAGIGGAWQANCGDITITGGSITAIGGSSAAGIGGGRDADCGAITIGAGITSVVATSNSAQLPCIGAGESGTVDSVSVDPSLYDTTSADGLTRTIVPAPVWDGNLATLTGDVTIESDMTLYGELAGQYKISIADGVTVTLDGAAITNGVSNSNYSWAGLNCLGDAEIVLAAGSANFVKGFLWDYPGIHVPAGSTLTISGSGSLDASSNGVGAGIGGGYQLDCGSIVIEGGVITATGGFKSAGIGAGSDAACGTITITGGRVTATGGDYAAGIGTGDLSSSCGNIAITGGSVTATGGTKGSGIGSADDSSSCGAITIGTDIVRVVATRGDEDAEPIGKGAGSQASCGTVTVDPSLTDTTSADGNTRTITAASVWNGNLATLTGDVTIESDMTLYGELAGQYKISIADGVTVTLDGAAITNGVSNSNYSWAGLNCLGDAQIVLAPDSENFVKGFLRGYPGIYVLENKTLTISGSGSLDAGSNGRGAGIGGGYQLDCGNIVINGGTIIAAGGTQAPGIGTGSSGQCGDITITGGQVTATGGAYAAGIGTGDYTSSCGAITITGGSVTATGGTNGAGIGSADDSSACGAITIGADIDRVEATCGIGAAPIGKGGGSNASCGTVTIDPSLFDDEDTPTRTISSTPPPVQSETIGGVTWYYRMCGTMCEIYNDGNPAVSPAPSGALEIPATLGGAAVKAIGDFAFVNNEDLVSVVIPDGVKSIGQSAFYACTSLSSVTIPRSVVSIGNHAFGYSGLETAYVARGRTNAIKEMLIASGHETAFVDGITFVEPVWDGNLATLDEDIVIDRDMTIYGELAGQYKISIADGVTVTLDNAVVTNGLDNSSYPWAGLTCVGDAEIVLANGSENFVKGFYRRRPGIYVPAGSTLTITGSGTLDARSNGTGAGIGGGYQIDCGNITIEGGTIVATGGSYSAGIGAGSDGSCGDITISGGSVTATGGGWSAGIGTGDYGSRCGDISITGGSVTATGGSLGAGIGSADNSSACGAITIGAGIDSVVATCGSGARPVGKGGGSNASCGTVAIDPGLLDDDGNPVRTIMSTAPVQSETIGGVTWYYRMCGTMCEIYNDGNPAVSPAPSGALEIPATLGGSTVTAIGDFAFVNSEDLVSVVIPDGVKSIGQSAFYACTSLSSVTIPRSVVSIGNHAFGYSGLETAYVARGRTNAIKEMLIASGHETAFVDGITFVEPVWDGNLATLDEDIVIDRDMTVYGELAGLYRISIADGVTVTLDNAVITNGESVAVDEDYSWAGITCEGDATIILAPGSVNETVGFYEEYPGIYVPVGSTLTIRGTGALYARSSVGYNGLMWACGIGGGYDIDCGNITIEGGTIYAIGGNTAAAIGGGWEAACGDITITGGDITATGGPYAAGIGCGYSYYSAGTGSCGAITIGAGVVRIVATAIVDNSDGEPISAEKCGAPIGAGGNGGICGTISIDPGLTDDNGIPVRTITGSGFAGYVAWASENGVTGGWSAVDANGIANVFRYVFNKATGDFAVILGIEFNAEGKAVIKTPPVVNESGFTLSIKASDDLDGTGNTAAYGLNPTGETVIDEARSAKRFFRLKVEQAQ